MFASCLSCAPLTVARHSLKTDSEGPKRSAKNDSDSSPLVVNWQYHIMSMQPEERRVFSAGLPDGPVTHQHCGDLLVPALRVFNWSSSLEL